MRLIRRTTNLTRGRDDGSDGGCRGSSARGSLKAIGDEGGANAHFRDHGRRLKSQVDGVHPGPGVVTELDQIRRVVLECDIYALIKDDLGSGRDGHLRQVDHLRH